MIVTIRQFAFDSQFFHSAAVGGYNSPRGSEQPEEVVAKRPRLACYIWLTVPVVSIDVGSQQKQSGGLRTLTLIGDSDRETFELYCDVIDKVSEQPVKREELWVEVCNAHGIVP